MKKWYANVSVLIVIFISLAGVATASLFFLLLPQSSEIVQLMQWRMANADDFVIDADVRYEGTKNVVFDSSGSFDRRDPAKPLADQRFSLRLGADSPLAFDGRYVRVGSGNFFNFSALPDQVGALHFADFKNRWLRIDVARLLSLTALPAVGGDYPPISAEDERQLVEDFRATPFLLVDERLHDETLGGVSTYHYKVTPELLFFKDFYIRFETKRIGRDLTNKERIAADRFFANFIPEDGELWIDKRDAYLARMRLRFRHDDGTNRGTLSLTINVSPRDIPAAAAAPDGVEDVTDVLASLLPGLSAHAHLPLAENGAAPRGAAVASSGGLQISSPSSGDQDPDHDGLSNILERFYGTDPMNPDTDGDGMNDGDEVKAGRNPTGPGLLFDFTGGKF